MNTCVFIDVVVVVGLPGGRFADEKACRLSSKTQEKNVCRGRMIELSTEMARVVGGGSPWKFCVMKRPSDRKCLNLAHAQSFDRCERPDLKFENSRLPVELCMPT